MPKLSSQPIYCLCPSCSPSRPFVTQHSCSPSCPTVPQLSSQSSYCAPAVIPALLLCPSFSCGGPPVLQLFSRLSYCSLHRYTSCYSIHPTAHICYHTYPPVPQSSSQPSYWAQLFYQPSYCTIQIFSRSFSCAKLSSQLSYYIGTADIPAVLPAILMCPKRPLTLSIKKVNGREAEETIHSLYRRAADLSPARRPATPELYKDTFFFGMLKIDFQKM